MESQNERKNKKLILLAIIPSIPCFCLYLLVLKYKMLEDTPSHCPSGEEYIQGFTLFVSYCATMIISFFSSIFGIIIGFMIFAWSFEVDHKNKRNLSYWMIVLSVISLLLTWCIIERFMELL